MTPHFMLGAAASETVRGDRLSAEELRQSAPRNPKWCDPRDIAARGDVDAVVRARDTFDAMCEAVDRRLADATCATEATRDPHSWRRALAPVLSEHADFSRLA